MRKKSFTLIEIIIVVVVVGILATMALPAYQNVVENSKAKICETNLKTEQESLEIYLMEHDTMPGTLSQIPREYKEKAYARILQQKDAWKVKLAYFIVSLEQKGIAYAGFLLDEIAKGEIELITCPKDPTPPAQGGISYGLNSILANMSSQDYRNLPADTLLISDCDSATFTTEVDLADRHIHRKILVAETYALGANKGGSVVKHGKGYGPGGKYGRGGPGDDDDDD